MEVVKTPTQIQRALPREDLELDPQHRPVENPSREIHSLLRELLGLTLSRAQVELRSGDREVVRRTFLEAAQTNGQPQSGALFRVFWELEHFMQEEFHSGQRLGQVIALTGSEGNAEATTCKEYLCRTWPKIGLTLLNAIETALSLKRVGSGERSITFHEVG